MFSSAERPTALVFSSFHSVTITMMTELKKLGLSIPEDISLIGFDNLGWTTCTDPAVTVLDQPLFDIGHRAVTNLLNQINGSIFMRQEILPVKMIERDSVATCK
jgi:LacI family transcriptional regulator